MAVNCQHNADYCWCIYRSWLQTLAESMQSRRTLTLTLSLLERERGTFGGTASVSPNRDPKQVRSGSPLPARSGEIKVRGAFDCIVTAQRLRGVPLFSNQFPHRRTTGIDQILRTAAEIGNRDFAHVDAEVVIERSEDV